MGFMKISELAHKMEDVLGRVRNKELGVSKEIVDLYLDCFNALEKLTTQVTNKQEENFDINLYHLFSVHLFAD